MASLMGSPVCDLCGTSVPRVELQNGEADTVYGVACAGCRPYYDEVRRRRRVRYHRQTPSTRPADGYRYVSVKPARNKEAAGAVSPEDCRWLAFSVRDARDVRDVPVKTARLPAAPHVAEWLALLLNAADAAVEALDQPHTRRKSA